MIVFQRTNGRAHDVIVKSDDYVLAAGEFSVPGFDMPDIETLHEPGSDDPSVLTLLRSAAAQAVIEEQITTRALDQDAPKAVRDYVAERDRRAGGRR